MDVRRRGLVLYYTIHGLFIVLFRLFATDSFAGREVQRAFLHPYLAHGVFHTRWSLPLAVRPVEPVRSPGVASPKGADDALAALMSEAGMEEQATRLRRLKVQR